MLKLNVLFTHHLDVIVCYFWVNSSTNKVQISPSTNKWIISIRKKKFTSDRFVIGLLSLMYYLTASRLP